MNRTILLAALAASAAAGQAGAQSVIYWPAPTAVTGQTRYMAMGTPLFFVTRTELNTKANKAGDRFYAVTTQALTDNGQVIVPAGAVAEGEVVRAERNGHLGKRGEIEVRLLSVQTPNGPIRLAGKTAAKGRDQRLLSIGGAILIGGWGPLLIHGTSGRIAADTPVTAYLAEDVRYAVAAPGAVPAVAAVRTLPARFDPSVFASR